MTQTECKQIDAYWRAANYLAAGQLYLLDNPLLRRPLTRDDVAMMSRKKLSATGERCPARTLCMSISTGSSRSSTRI